jgi:DNA-binding GntR family transcriptional regulator
LGALLSSASSASNFIPRPTRVSWTGAIEQLFDASDYYRHFSRVSRSMRRIRTDKHEAIMKAAISRDTDRASSLLKIHFQKTADLVRRRLEQRI